MDGGRGDRTAIEIAASPRSGRGRVKSEDRYVD
jgi:hypothetical protein